MYTTFDTKSVEDYRRFKAIKKLPAYSIRGRMAEYPDEYAHLIDGKKHKQKAAKVNPPSFLYDYQRGILELAIRKQKFCVFADCGLGKSLIMLAYARHVLQAAGGRVLILTPPMVVPQLAEESRKFLPDLPIETVKAAKLSQWMGESTPMVGITNYEALKDETPQGKLKALILDESSVLKGHYGKYAEICLRLGQGLQWKLCATGTPAPNDRIEYANHAVFMDRFPTVNSFLARYFINRGETNERWELRPHALRPFYRSLSDWCIFLSDPAVYGWKDNCGKLPPIHTHIHEVDLTQQQKDWVQKELGSLIATRAGGITYRSAYGQVSKGFWKGKPIDTHKPEFIRSLVAQWQENESTLVWCLYDREQEELERVLPNCESLDGSTPFERRIEAIARFKSRESKTLVSKPKILGFGLNLQVATRQVFSGLQDSYESYYQCVKRSNRIGSTLPLNVHIPVTELEEPMVENVLRKAHRVEQDTREQEAIFKECMV